MNKTCAKRRKQKIFQQASAGEKSYHERETICSSKLCLGYFSSLFEIQILWWVSSTPFGIPFHLPVQFQNRGSSHLQMASSEGFQQHFSIISKSVCCGFYMKKNVAFTLISFTVLK